MSAEIISVALLQAAISLAAFLANLIVILAVAYSRSLKTVSNAFITSLSIADILVATVVMIPSTVNTVHGRWIFPEELCTVWNSFDVMLCSASVLQICAISFDRYLAIMSPLRYTSLMTIKRALLIIAVMWSISILTSFVPINEGWHQIGYGFSQYSNHSILRSEKQCILRVSFTYALLAGSITLMVPMVISLVLYFKVSEEAKRQELFMKTLIAPTRVLLGKDVTSKSVREPITRKSSITLGVIVGAYIITWTPFVISNIVDSACHCVPEAVTIYITWLGWCNSLINPIIYPLFMRDFKKVYKKMFTACCPVIKFHEAKSHDFTFKLETNHKSPPAVIPNSHETMHSSEV